MDTIGKNQEYHFLEMMLLKITNSSMAIFHIFQKKQMRLYNGLKSMEMIF